jgi:hypothetical protein
MGRIRAYQTTTRYAVSWYSDIPVVCPLVFWCPDLLFYRASLMVLLQAGVGRLRPSDATGLTPFAFVIVILIVMMQYV